MPFLDIHGARLYYECHGAGPALILAHGGGANHMSWYQQVPALSQYYQVIVFDHRGFGISSDDGTGAEAFVSDLVRLVDHLGLESVALVGQSMGAMTVAGFASVRPDQVRLLALSSSHGALNAPFKIASGTPNPFAAPAGPPRTYPEIMATQGKSDGFEERDPLKSFLYRQLGSINVGVDVQKLSVLQGRHYALGPILEARIPMLLLNGDIDVETCESMRQLSTRMPGCELIIEPGVGHLLYFERPAVYNAHLLEFCHRSDPALAGGR